MSFFGLTALGPQSPFLAASSGDKTLLHVFDEDDFKSAFDKIENNGVIKASDLIDLLQIVYRGPVPSHLSELEKLRSALHVQNDNEPISWVSFSQCNLPFNWSDFKILDEGHVTIDVQGFKVKIMFRFVALQPDSTSRCPDSSTEGNELCAWWNGFDEKCHLHVSPTA